MLSVPVTLIILVLTFGALVAAGVPLLLGVTAVVGTIGLLGPISHLVSLDEFINEIVLLVGLAVGVDYSLFYLRREREEKARGHSPKDAVAIAAATSGRAVLISGRDGHRRDGRACCSPATRPSPRWASAPCWWSSSR